MISTDPDKIIWNCVWNFAATCISDAIPGFYVTSQSLLGTFFPKETLVYDQHYKDVHV